MGYQRICAIFVHLDRFRFHRRYNNNNSGSVSWHVASVSVVSCLVVPLVATKARKWRSCYRNSKISWCLVSTNRWTPSPYRDWVGRPRLTKRATVYTVCATQFRFVVDELKMTDKPCELSGRGRGHNFGARSASILRRRQRADGLEGPTLIPLQEKITLYYIEYCILIRIRN